MVVPPPELCTGAVVGALRPPELELELELELERELELEVELDELESWRFGVAACLFACFAGTDELLLFVCAVLCVDPGSTKVTTPAAATLARLTTVVVRFSRDRPSSRSAIAWLTPRRAEFVMPESLCIELSRR